MILWTILDVAFRNDDFDMGLMLLRLIVIAAFGAMIAYFYTDHLMKNYEQITPFAIGMILLYKFGIEAGFGIVGTISYGLVPLCTYILFNVNIIKITFVNLVSIIIFIIQFSINGNQKESDTGKLAVIIISYTILLIGITFICGIVGLWHD